MAFTATKTLTRTSRRIPWWIVPPETLQYYKTTYDDTGKRLSLEVHVSDDGLQQIAKSTWINKEAYDEFAADIKQRDISHPDWSEHNGVNNIQTVWVTSEV